ncbi:MAG: DEAD/DEAH box helicase [Treponema sp.]|jgi:superfamily II DNA/RNA helicase|nr:DEAD/DEAH box helicase [Treponema sp.]
MTTTFEDLGLSPFFTARLGVRNIYKPTDIQRQVIPALLEGRSLAFRSATGTGKTFAYLLPLLQRLFPGARPGGGYAGPALLILAPTSELCSQIRAEADFLLEAPTPPLPPGMSTGLFIGSGNLKRQIESLKKERPALVVGNPGRVLLLARMGKLKFGALRALVFDEGDRLAAEDLRGETLELLDLIARASGGKRAPSPQGPSRQDGGPESIRVACSATLSPKNLAALLPFLGEDLSFIETDEQEILRERIQHWAMWSEERRKIGTLRSFLAAVKPGKALVFTSRSWDAEHVVSRLSHLSAAALYGHMDKKRRRDLVGAFRSGKIRVLVSSDLAARGLDIPGITHVIALDVPRDSDLYIHRAGRTGRAGKRGIMVSIGDEAEMRRLALLEKRLGLTVYPKELYGGRVVASAGEES